MMLNIAIALAPGPGLPRRAVADGQLQAGAAARIVLRALASAALAALVCWALNDWLRQSQQRSAGGCCQPVHRTHHRGMRQGAADRRAGRDRPRRLPGRRRACWALPSAPASRWSRTSRTCASCTRRRSRLWLVRGLGTAVMHGSDHRDLRDAVAKTAPTGASGWLMFVPGLLAGRRGRIHRSFNHRLLPPLAQTLADPGRPAAADARRCSNAASAPHASGSAPGSTSISSCCSWSRRSISP